MSSTAAIRKVASPVLKWPGLRPPRRPIIHGCYRTGLRRLFTDAATSSPRIEESSLPHYSQKRYYPVHIGQRFADRYTVITKLGFGAYSTVWLARDESTERYAALKVSVQDDSPTSPILREIANIQHLKACRQDHAGAPIARLPYDMFQLEGPRRRHHCLVSDPQGCNLWTLRHLFPGSRLPPEFVKTAVRSLLACASWLNVNGNLIHTDITTTNVLTECAHEELFASLELEQKLKASTPVIIDGHPVYQSLGQPRNMLDLTGMAYLTDFGSARSRDATNVDWCMSDTYRAPEILMSVRWGCQVDVWSIGILALELMQGASLFNPIDYEHKQYVLPLALAQYISALGALPLWMIQESQSLDIPTFFDAEGRWTGEPPIPQFSLEDWLTAVPAGKEKDMFIKFMRRILVWDSMERATTYDLLYDDWQEVS